MVGSTSGPPSKSFLSICFVRRKAGQASTHALLVVQLWFAFPRFACVPTNCYIFGETKVLVFNCDEGIDFQSMGRIFIGLVKVGLHLALKFTCFWLLPNAKLLSNILGCDGSQGFVPPRQVYVGLLYSQRLDAVTVYSGRFDELGACYSSKLHLSIGKKPHVLKQSGTNKAQPR